MTVIIFCVSCVFIQISLTYGSSLPFCPFFNNRGPSEQPGLQNCTWFKKKSCCMQQEIEATFGSVKPLQGASVSCQKHTNYLMCYICAPNQNIFYKRERLTVCEEFCDSLFEACKNAILKGSVIQDLYSNGKAFCESRSYQVESEKDRKNKNYKLCFDFDKSLDISSSSWNLQPNYMLIVCAVIQGCLQYWSIIGLIRSIFTPNEYRRVKMGSSAKSGYSTHSRIDNNKYSKPVLLHSDGSIVTTKKIQKLLFNNDLL